MYDGAQSRMMGGDILRKATEGGLLQSAVAGAFMQDDEVQC